MRLGAGPGGGARPLGENSRSKAGPRGGEGAKGKTKAEAGLGGRAGPLGEKSMQKAGPEGGRG